MTKHAKSFFIAIIAATATLLSTTAQTRSQGVGPESPAEVVKARENFPVQQDKGVADFVTAMVGMHRGNDHTLYINSVELPDSAPAMYVELVTAGEENHPVRQQLWVPHRRDGELRMRACELPMGMRDLVVGMWAAPALYPAARLEQYASLGDLIITGGDGEYSLQSPIAMAIAREGAIEYEIQIDRTAGGVRWVDSGRAIDGEVVFDLEIEMKTRPALPVAKELDGGILVYDLREGFVGAAPIDTDSIAFNFSEWTMDGILIDSTDRPHRGAHVFTIPDEVKALRSWNLGVIGLREGGIRRVYDPTSHAGLLDGEVKPFRGQPRPLLTELTCISVKDNTR